MKTKNLFSKVAKTTLATALLLFFFFAQGAVLIIKQSDGLEARLVSGLIIWLSVLMGLLFYSLQARDVSTLGFSKMRKNSARELLAFLPLILVALLAFVGGLASKSAYQIFAFLFLTLAVGFAEEMYFRGIICRLWFRESVKAALIISSLCFAFSHLLNMVGGASLTKTLLQVCFDFLYGLVLAMIFILSSSLLPCILLHTFHNFYTFISARGNMLLTFIVGSLQFAILAVYALFSSKNLRLGLTLSDSPYLEISI